MRLLIVSHTPHYLRQGQLVGWGPTVREIDWLSTLFREVVHLAPLHQGTAPASALPYASGRVRFVPVAPAGGTRLSDKIGILGRAPEYLHAIGRQLSKADAVHVRCPANISMMALVLLLLRRHPRCRWVKYAGNWRPAERTPFSYLLQRRWLDYGWHRGVVTVNGSWPGQPSHVFSFLNPSLTMREVQEAARLVSGKLLREPYCLLYVGQVNLSKGVGRLLEVAQQLRQRGCRFQVHIVGDGPQRAMLQDRAQNQGLGSVVRFHGWLPRPRLAEFYAQAHFLVHPSDSEGWAKVLSEAMAYGVVPIAGAVASIPQILEETGAGVAVPPHDVGAFAREIMGLVEAGERWRAMRLAGMQAAPRFTYEAYLEAVRRMFRQVWGVLLPVAGETW